MTVHGTRIQVLRQELRIGMGDVLFPYPVQLEPHFLPFDPFRPWVPSRSLSRDGVVEEMRFVRIRPSEEDRYSSDLAEQLLLSLNSSWLIAFEVVGVEGEVRLQIASLADDAAFISGQIEAHYPNAEAFFDDDLLADVVDRIGAVRAYRLRRPHLFCLKDGHRVDPYTSLIGVMATIGSQDVAVFQMLFAPVAHDWKANALRLSRHPYDSSKSMFTDLPQLPKKADAKTSRPLFSGGLRMAASSEELLDVLERAFLAQFDSEDNRLEKI